MAHFLNKGAYGVGFDPKSAKALIAEAANLGDPGAKDLLARRVEAEARGSEPQ